MPTLSQITIPVKNTSTGQVTNITYSFAGGSGVNVVAPIETSPSENSYEEGQYLIFEGTLYLVIADIDVGDLLVEDANISEENYIADSITHINQTLNDIDTTPTSGSNKLVTSGGVYSYVDSMITQAIAASY